MHIKGKNLGFFIFSLSLFTVGVGFYEQNLFSECEVHFSNVCLCKEEKTEDIKVVSLLQNDGKYWMYPPISYG